MALGETQASRRGSEPVQSRRLTAADSNGALQRTDILRGGRPALSSEKIKCSPGAFFLPHILLFQGLRTGSKHTSRCEGPGRAHDEWTACICFVICSKLDCDVRCAQSRSLEWNAT